MMWKRYSTVRPYAHVLEGIFYPMDAENLVGVCEKCLIRYNFLTCICVAAGSVAHWKYHNTIYFIVFYYAAAAEVNSTTAGQYCYERARTRSLGKLLAGNKTVTPGNFIRINNIEIFLGSLQYCNIYAISPLKYI